MSRMKERLHEVGICGGCYDSIYENEQYYVLETKNGPVFVHGVVSCCVDFVSENGTVHTGFPKKTRRASDGGAKIVSIFTHCKAVRN